MKNKFSLRFWKFSKRISLFIAFSIVFLKDRQPGQRSFKNTIENARPFGGSPPEASYKSRIIIENMLHKRFYKKFEKLLNFSSIFLQNLHEKLAKNTKFCKVCKFSLTFVKFLGTFSVVWVFPTPVGNRFVGMVRLGPLVKTQNVDLLGKCKRRM